MKITTKFFAPKNRSPEFPQKKLIGFFTITTEDWCYTSIALKISGEGRFCLLFPSVKIPGGREGLYPWIEKQTYYPINAETYNSILNAILSKHVGEIASELMIIKNFEVQNHGK